MTITTQDAQNYIGKHLFDADGSKVGKIGSVFLDDATGQPEWVTVSTGFFGNHESFVPLTGASAHDDGLGVPFSKDQIKNAPNVDLDDRHLSSEEEDSLYAYYGPDTPAGSAAAPAADRPEVDAAPKARLRRWVGADEHPVVNSETVPVERIQLGTDPQETTRTVQGDVHKERVEPDERVESNGQVDSDADAS